MQLPTTINKKKKKKNSFHKVLKIVINVLDNSSILTSLIDIKLGRK